MRRTLTLATPALAAVLAALGAQAQTPLAGALEPDRERSDRLLAPEPAPPPPQLALPPAEALSGPRGALRNQTQFTLSAITVEGAQSLPAAEIEAITAGYLNRPIDVLDLGDLARAITGLYVQRGYLNSGARIPDQDVSDGRLEIVVSEGVLEAIRVAGVSPAGQRRIGSLSERYVAERLRAGVTTPFDLNVLQGNFQLLAEDPYIAEIDARLRPATEPGVAALEVDVRQPKPWFVALSAASERSPTIGGDRIGLDSGFQNLIVSGDRLSGGVGFGEGFEDYRLEYAAPLNARGWTLSVAADIANSDIIEDPFDVLDIEADGETYRIDLTIPVQQRFGRRLGVGVGLERRESRTAIAGFPFSLSADAVNGEAQVSFLRLTQDFVQRSPREALALESRVHFGLEGPDPTGPIGAEYEDHFLQWLGQARYLRRFGALSQMSLAADVQLASGPQFSAMRYVIGGLDSVRGYRRAAAVGDNAARISAQWERRLPAPRFGDQPSDLRGRVFLDAGHLWNDDASGAPLLETLASVGLEVEWRITKSVSVMAFAALPFADDLDVADEDLQDQGFGYRLVARY